MKKIFFASILMLFFVLSNSKAADWNNCPPPANITVTTQTTSSISFDWGDCGCAFTEYRVYFETGGQTSAEYSSNSSGISFIGLPEGSYRFYFYTVCGGVVSSIIIEDLAIG